jgi:NADPH-dependent 2,4-dienoyl-CoA reductase/sulfur reductase-like enzyme
MGQVVIVGAGQAGRRTAELLRQLDPEIGIVIVGKEPHRPYERPPLSKAGLLCGPSGARIFIRDAEYYEKNRIGLLLGKAVERIDRARREVVMEDGRRLPYDHLVLATGSSARRLSVPGADDPDIFYLRTIEDAENLRRRLPAQPSIAIVGGGLIGLEVAATARGFGCKVTLLEGGPQLMGRSVPAEVGNAILGLHVSRGADIRIDDPVCAIERHMGTRKRIVSARSEVIADLVVVGIGATPNTVLAAGAGLEVDNGLVVDEYGRTSDPAILGAGEVTCHFNPRLNKRMRLESWQVAQYQPEAVANSILGKQIAYERLPWSWSDQFNWNIQIFGEPSPGHPTVTRRVRDDSFIVATCDGDRLAAAVLVNSGREARPLGRLIEAGAAMSWAAFQDAAIGIEAARRQ